MKFEEALEKLENIIREMEEGELPLRESLDKYEEGAKLVDFCRKKLEAAEKKIEILRRTPEGEVRQEPFENQLSSDEEESRE